MAHHVLTQLIPLPWRPSGPANFPDRGTPPWGSPRASERKAADQGHCVGLLLAARDAAQRPQRRGQSHATKKKPTSGSTAPEWRSPTSGDVPGGFQLSTFLSWGKGVLTLSYVQEAAGVRRSWSFQPIMGLHLHAPLAS